MGELQKQKKKNTIFPLNSVFSWVEEEENFFFWDETYRCSIRIQKSMGMSLNDKNRKIIQQIIEIVFVSKTWTMQSV